jgi:hypothetical protein
MPDIEVGNYCCPPNAELTGVQFQTIETFDGIVKFGETIEFCGIKDYIHHRKYFEVIAVVKRLHYENRYINCYRWWETTLINHLRNT